MLTDKERYFANALIGVIDNVDCPKLVYQEEKDVVKKALELLLYKDESERRGK